MKKEYQEPSRWRIWIDTRSRELFLRCIDQYSAAQYRYQ